jgi:hypothetical protein
LRFTSQKAFLPLLSFIHNHDGVLRVHWAFIGLFNLILNIAKGKRRPPPLDNPVTHRFRVFSLFPLSSVCFSASFSYANSLKTHSAFFPLCPEGMSRKYEYFAFTFLTNGFELGTLWQMDEHGA